MRLRGKFGWLKTAVSVLCVFLPAHSHRVFLKRQPISGGPFTALRLSVLPVF